MKQMGLFEGRIRQHPIWGYNLDKVPGVHCFRCDEPISDREYIECTSFARFGEMYFYHVDCLSDRELDKQRTENEKRAKKMQRRQCAPDCPACAGNV